MKEQRAASEAGSSWDPAWEQVFRAQEWGKYPPEHVIRFVARTFYQAPDRRAVRLLDLGSGSGACTWFMAREGFSVSAIDGSATAIARLQSRLGAEGLAVDARVGDFVTLPWPDDSFDGVVDNVALCCNSFAACRMAAAEVYRVLKPAGAFYSANLSDRSWGYGRGRPVEPGGFTDITEGPVAGKGFVLFMGRAQLDEVYSRFEDVNVERVSWTLGGMDHLVEFWVVTSRKPS
jgi:SAM-dependent methyltransferase